MQKFLNKFTDERLAAARDVVDAFLGAMPNPFDKHVLSFLSRYLRDELSEREQNRKNNPAQPEPDRRMLVKDWVRRHGGSPDPTLKI